MKIIAGSVISLIWAALLSAWTAQALHFYLESNEQRCFLEELPSDTVVEGHYRALEWVEENKSWEQSKEMGIQVVVEEVASGEVVANVHGKPEGKFTFTSHEPGDHSICLQSNSSSGYFSSTHIKLYLDIAVGTTRRDPSHDTGHIQTLASKLQDLNDRVSAVRREQQYQREIEATFRDASERVNGRAVWWSVWQIVVLIGVAVAEMRYLKHYFADKKLR
ncbi:hypothetical protein FFLO_03369 [Filobasidium floriforme]|uniref:GOLD domain-containing protein n=1 Tax=Filobasidium floriforme TaxID=5210 RepID=A0A8K0JL97_9TREE|nr:putative ER to Golgi transport-related protein [Filobasidium floriforme]KAG7544256.1 hypothetical protein FFLO_03369 [Filobasidium floriforme]KAH8085717.1 putative ER to Golgi transport-related protein [Filobasidium floriforme]